MKKTLVRLYDRHDANSLKGKCYFLVVPCEWDEISDYDYWLIMDSVTSMQWQKYNAYAVGKADIDDSELYWSEVMGYEWHEVLIDIERVTITGKYHMPEKYWKYN